MTKSKKIIFISLCILLLAGILYYTNINNQNTVTKNETPKNKISPSAPMYTETDKLTMRSHAVVLAIVKNITPENKLIEVPSTSQDKLYNIISEMQLEVIRDLKNTLEPGTIIPVHKIIGMRSSNEDFYFDELRTTKEGEQLLYFLKKEVIDGNTVYYPSSFYQAEVLIDDTSKGKAGLINNAEAVTVNIEKSKFPMFKEVKNLKQLEDNVKNAIKNEPKK